MTFCLKNRVLLLIIATFTLFTAVLLAQNVVSTAENVSIADLLPRAEVLKTDTQHAIDIITGLKDITETELLYTNAKTRFESYKHLLNDLKSSKSNELEHIRAVSSNIRNIDDMISNALSMITKKLNTYESIKAEFKIKQTEWKTRKESSLTTSQAIRDVFIEVESALKKLNNVIDQAEPILVENQLRIIQLQRDTRNLSRQASDLSEEIRKNLFDLTANPMYSKAFFNEFNIDFAESFKNGLISVQLPIKDFFDNNFKIIIAQIILIWLLAALLRQTQKAEIEGLLLNKIAENYRYASILCSLILTMPLLEKVPTTIEFLYTVAIFISILKLASAIIECETKRKIVYGAMGLLILTDLFEIISLPIPFFRLFGAVIALFGIIFMYGKKYKQAESSKARSTWLAILYDLFAKLLIIIFAVAFVAQIIGYSGLSFHLLSITLKSLFTGLTGWIFVIISDDILYVILNNKRSQKTAFINAHSKVLLNHSVFLVNTFIIAISLARILSTLGAFESTDEGISQIMSLGITFNEIKLTIGIIVFAILSAYVTLGVSWLIQRILEEEILPKYRVEKGVGISINRLINYFFITLSVLIVFSTIGVGIQSLTVIFGALGIGIGFGLQNIVNNFASGIILLFERSIKVGDIVVVGGEWGTVKKLGLRATVIQTFDNSEMIVPNSNLVSSTVNNWTLSERKTRFVASVGVDYDSDIQLVTKLLLEAASNHPKVMQDPAPSVVFTAFGDSSLNFDLRGWVPDIDFRASTKNEIMYEINRLFRENNIVIPFPQRDIHIKEPLKIQETTKKD